MTKVSARKWDLSWWKQLLYYLSCTYVICIFVETGLSSYHYIRENLWLFLGHLLAYWWNKNVLNLLKIMLLVMQYLPNKTSNYKIDLYINKIRINLTFYSIYFEKIFKCTNLGCDIHSSCCSCVRKFCKINNIVQHIVIH